MSRMNTYEEITFEEYMQACRAPYEDPVIANEKSRKRKLIWVKIKGYRVLAIKNTKRAPKALVTCLPPEDIHNW